MNARATYTVQEAAAELGIGPNRLYSWLRAQRVLDAGNIPYQQFRDRGLLRVRYGHWEHPVVGTRYYARPLITRQGLAWLRGRLSETFHQPHQQEHAHP